MKTYKCPNCRGPMTSVIGKHRYTECGLNNVELVGVETRTCPACHETAVAIPCIEELHRVIAFQLAVKRGRLVPAEFRFLRTYLGHSRADFAEKIGVSASDVDGWEEGRVEASVVQEISIRMMAVLNGPVARYPDDPVAVVRHLTDAPPKPSELRLARTLEHWSQMATAL